MNTNKTRAAVAVVVPVYNRLELVRATIASLRAQTLEQAQFVIVDDRSEPAVWSFLQSLPSEDDRFTVLRTPDGTARGAQRSRNLGLDTAVAESVMFLDSDDLIEPGCLSDRVACLESHPYADIIVGRQAVLTDTSLTWVNVARADISYLDRFLACAGRIDVPWVNGGVIIRLKSLRTLGIRWRPEFHWDDVAFHVECLVAGMLPVPMPPISVPDSYYLSHDSERYGTFLASEAGIENAAIMFEWLRSLVDTNALMTDSRARALANSFFHFCIRQPTEMGNQNLARRLFSRARTNGLLTRDYALRIEPYLAAAALRSVSHRLASQAIRIAQKTLMKDFFPDLPSTFSSVAVPSKSELNGTSDNWHE